MASADTRLTAPKKGGEGDCGACTAVIARKQSDGRLAFTAVNSHADGHDRRLCGDYR